MEIILTVLILWRRKRKLKKLIKVSLRQSLIIKFLLIFLEINLSSGEDSNNDKPSLMEFEQEESVSKEITYDGVEEDRKENDPEYLENVKMWI